TYNKVTLPTGSCVSGIAVDSSGNLYITCSTSYGIYKIAGGAGGNVTLLTNQLGCTSLAISPGGVLYAACSSPNGVISISTSGGTVTVSSVYSGVGCSIVVFAHSQAYAYCAPNVYAFQG